MYLVEEIPFLSTHPWADRNNFILCSSEFSSDELFSLEAVKTKLSSPEPVAISLQFLLRQDKEEVLNLITSRSAKTYVQIALGNEILNHSADIERLLACEANMDLLILRPPTPEERERIENLRRKTKRLRFVLIPSRLFERSTILDTIPDAWLKATSFCFLNRKSPLDPFLLPHQNLLVAQVMSERFKNLQMDNLPVVRYLSFGDPYNLAVQKHPGVSAPKAVKGRSSNKFISLQVQRLAWGWRKLLFPFIYFLHLLIHHKKLAGIFRSMKSHCNHYSKKSAWFLYHMATQLHWRLEQSGWFGYHLSSQTILRFKQVAWFFYHLATQLHWRLEQSGWFGYHLSSQTILRFKQVAWFFYHLGSQIHWRLKQVAWFFYHLGSQIHWRLKQVAWFFYHLGSQTHWRLKQVAWFFYHLGSQTHWRLKQVAWFFYHLGSQTHWRLKQAAWFFYHLISQTHWRLKQILWFLLYPLRKAYWVAESEIERRILKREKNS